MRVVFAGTPETALPSLDALLDSSHDVAAVVTRPDARSGRGRRFVSSPVGRRAAEAGVEVLKPERADDPAFLERLREIEPDCCPIVAYGALLRQPVLDIPRHGWVNLHFSLLPAWRGAAPVQHAVLAGDDVVGASTFRVEAGMDTGPVYGVITERPQATDTSGRLLERLAESGAVLLVRTLDGIESGSVEPRPQPDGGVSHASKFAPEDARVDWTQPSGHIDRLIRACTPAPGAWTLFRGERLKFGPVRPLVGDDLAADELGAADLCPGRLRGERERVVVGTGSREVELGEVQPHGKRWIPATDWARGVRLIDDDRLE